jgi:hypothetical protein
LLIKESVFLVFLKVKLDPLAKKKKKKCEREKEEMAIKTAQPWAVDSTV